MHLSWSYKSLWVKVVNDSKSQWWKCSVSFIRWAVILDAEDRHWDSTLPGPGLPWAHSSGTLCWMGALASCWASLYPAVYGDAAYRLTVTVWCLLPLTFLFESAATLSSIFLSLYFSVSFWCCSAEFRDGKSMHCILSVFLIWRISVRKKDWSAETSRCSGVV